MAKGKKFKNFCDFLDLIQIKFAIIIYLKWRYGVWSMEYGVSKNGNSKKYQITNVSFIYSSGL